MKNTNADWISLIKARQHFDQVGGDVVVYLADTFNAINSSKIAGENAIIFMENIGHVLPFRILKSFSSSEINRLFVKHDFETVIKTFFSQYSDLALSYAENNKISEIQYGVFQKFLLFKHVEDAANINKKRFLLTLKRNKNNRNI